MPPPDTSQFPTETELAQQYWGRVRFFAARRLGNTAAAEDVAQETLRRVVDALRAGRVERPETLPGFTFQTALHVCLHYHRSAGREAKALGRLHVEGSRPTDVPDPLTVLISEERRRAVRQALDTLEEGDRLLLRMAYFEQLDTEEMGRRLDATPGAVRVRKHRALQRLAGRLGEAPATNPR